jgi:cell division protease FtsH
MTAETDNACAPEHVETTLQSLAVRALGMSGADIERLIREARQRARRERRSLSYRDVDEAIGGTRPYVPAAQLWRRAVHEAGHVIARVKLGIGRVRSATINGSLGQSYVEHEVGFHELQTEADLTAMIVIALAGRAAEEELLGSVTMGAGGSAQSDLALATELAFDMEARFGFGGRWPLLYRAKPDSFSNDVELIERVNHRLDCAYKEARQIVRHERARVISFARLLVSVGTIEGRSLDDAIDALPERPASH